MAKRKKKGNGGKEIGIALVIIGSILFFLSQIIYKQLMVYIIISGLLSFVLGIYILIVCPHFKTTSKKFEVGVLLISAIFFFAAFYTSLIALNLSIGNEFSPIYYSYNCPNLITNNFTNFDYVILNSDLTKGIVVNLKFIGEGVCIGANCLERISWLPTIILPGKNQTFNMDLKITNNKKSSFKLETYNNFRWKMATSKCEY